MCFCGAKMAKYASAAILLLLGLIYGRCNGSCVRSSVTKIGMCSYTLQCQGTIRDVDLVFKCHRPDLKPIINLVLKDATERFDETLRPTHFLKRVTSLRAVGNWEKTALSILNYTPFLKVLIMSGKKIKYFVERPFFNLTNLRIIDISHNELTDVENLFRFQTKRSALKRLLMANNEITTLTKHTFEELHYLVELDLSNNSISDLSSSPFQNLKYLLTLKLNFNKIIQLSDSLNHLNYLKHLHLKGNQIRAIDDGLLHVILHLETFDVSLNDIDYLQSTIFLRNIYSPNSPHVYKVILSNNNIEALPNAPESRWETHARNTMMPAKANVSIVLDLSDNDIDEIAYRAFEGTNEIKSLDLSCNQLYQFHIRSEDLFGIERLNLSKNFLEHLNYESFSAMMQLEILDLSHNLIGFIPNGMFAKNHRLRYVNISNNQIAAVKGFQFRIFHANGGYLDFSRNGLSKFALMFGEAFRLRTLSLKSNNISDTREVKLNYQMDLRKLDMSNNSIQNLTENSLLFPSSLVFLDMSHNKIDTIVPSVFLQLRDLQVLHLSNNKLENLTFGIFRGLKNLKSLDLSYNKINILDSNSFKDLNSLRVLSVRYNGIQRVDEKYWIGHGYEITVYLDGNDLTCEWLNTAVDNYDNGWSEMRPTVIDPNIPTRDSVQNIPCTPEDRKIGFQRECPQAVLIDERLLVINRRILNELMYQNDYLRSILDFLVKTRRNQHQNF